MRIIFISHLSSKIAVGPNWSVPSGVDAQSKIDEVLWINMTPSEMPHWLKVNGYHNIKDFGKLSLRYLPKPFNQPDVVVFEGVFFIDYVVFARDLRNKNIPYIIVPRGSLTKQAMHNHAWIKKWFAKMILFRSFVNKAWRIQFLTKKEADDSKNNFTTKYIVVPNGFAKPDVNKTSFLAKGFQMTYIGRLDLYHKGIDLLLDAISHNRQLLISSGFCLRLYGPQRYDYNKIKNYIISNNLCDIVKLLDEISGEEKRQALLNTDVFVMTSRFEGHPMGLIEALAYGIPCLVTPGTNMAEEVKDFDAGWVTEEDSESIGNSLHKIILEKKLISQKGVNACQLANKYNWDNIANHFHSEINRINKYYCNETI